MNISLMYDSDDNIKLYAPFIPYAPNICKQKTFDYSSPPPLRKQNAFNYLSPPLLCKQKAFENSYYLEQNEIETELDFDFPIFRSTENCEDTENNKDNKDNYTTIPLITKTSSLP